MSDLPNAHDFCDAFGRTNNTAETVEAARNDARLFLATVQRECEATSHRIETALAVMDRRIADAPDTEAAVTTIAQIYLEALDPMDAFWKQHVSNTPIAIQKAGRDEGIGR